MGSSSSQLSSGRRSPDRFKFSSLICGGGSSSHTPLEIEDHPAEVLINSSEHCEPANFIPASSSNRRMGTVLSGLNISIGTGCEGDGVSMNVGTHLSENSEAVSSQQVFADSNRTKSYSGTASTSMKTEQSSDSLSVIEPSSNRTSVENHTDEANQVTAINIPDSTSVSHSSDLPAAYDTLREDESLLQVDVVSISSNVFSSNSTYHETRRNSRQLFRDAFSRRNSSRQLDLSPTIVLSAGDGNDSEPSNDRWVLDFGDDFFDDVLGRDYGYIGSRLSRLHERRRHSRSQIWESSRGDFDDNIRGATRCPTGLHPEGSCSCESFLVRGDSSGRSSISRIVMLAETLFEVLDEIHRQPGSLSLSIPAPESVVDSLPLKDHKRKDCVVDGDDFAQCHICLAEYEEGDKIRVLPCHHEYHKSCVDKWLKEIHGVCPLCRGDVRQGDTKRSAPQQEIHSAW